MLKKFRRKNLKKDKRGATLIEMLLVIAIIGILVALLVPNISKAKTTAIATAHNANVKMIESAAAMFMIDNPNFSTGELKLEELQEYLDQDIVLNKVVSESTRISSFTVNVNKEGITITPGEVIVDNGKITQK